MLREETDRSCQVLVQLELQFKDQEVPTIPPVPHDVDEVQIEDAWADTWFNERFLQHLDNDWGIAVFATEENLSNLAQCEVVYMDGTFKG